jgi:V8-like Glu-specific endopeptidase
VQNQQTLAGKLAAAPPAAKVLAGHAKVQENMDRVAAVVQAKDIRKAPQRGRVIVGSELARDRYVLCDEERFADVRVAAKCTAFLVADDMVATAAHCIDEQRLDPKMLDGLRFVFPDRSGEVDGNPWNVSKGNVYEPDRLVGWTPRTDAGAAAGEWALVRLKRNVEGRRPVALARKAAPTEGDPVYLLGHPLGLPLTFDGGSKRIVKANADGTLVTNLDAYKGNSGSPVFSANTHEVVGVLVTGDEDFENLADAGGCNRSIVCIAADCGAELSTSVTLFADRVPEKRDATPPSTPRRP